MKMPYGGSNWNGPPPSYSGQAVSYASIPNYAASPSPNSSAPPQPYGFMRPDPPQPSYPYSQPPSQQYGGFSVQSPPPTQSSYGAPPQPANRDEGPNTPIDNDRNISEPTEEELMTWRMGYVRKPEDKSSKTSSNNQPSQPSYEALPTGTISSADAAASDPGVAAIVSGPDGKQKTVERTGGGVSWQDPSLLEWNPAHFRLFVGNLAGEVTDDSLLKAFSRYASVQKTRVVRDKRTTKSKGYGFVSFSDGDDYFRAAKEMQGKYIGSHPVLLRKSTTDIKPVSNKEKKNKHGKGSHHAGANTGAGVNKKQGKMKGGLKLLG